MSSSDSISSTTSVAQGVPQPEGGPVVDLVRPGSSHSLESMRKLVPDSVKAKYRAQGYKKGGGLALSATIVPILFYFIKNDVESLLIACYCSVVALGVILSFIEPLLSIYFKKSDRLSEEYEEFIIVTLKTCSKWCYVSHGFILTYIFTSE